MTRERLPNRRMANSLDLEFDGLRFAVTVGIYPDGRPGEVFTHGVKVGSAMDAILDDACVVVSRLLQHRVEPADLARSMGRLGNGSSPASIIGAVVDLTATLAAEVRP
jgi:hypothetical protein